MSSTANYASSPNSAGCTINTANTNRDGTGTLGTVVTAGASGSRIDALTIKAQSTTTAGMIRLFVHDGSTARLLTEIPVQAATPSGTTPSWELAINYNNNPNFPLTLKTGFSLRAATNNAESFNVLPTLAGDF